MASKCLRAEDHSAGSEAIWAYSYPDARTFDYRAFMAASEPETTT
jgi:hypothetical protein